jgi:hypothetical protein
MSGCFNVCSTHLARVPGSIIANIVVHELLGIKHVTLQGFVQSRILSTQRVTEEVTGTYKEAPIDGCGTGEEAKAANASALDAFFLRRPYVKQVNMVMLLKTITLRELVGVARDKDTTMG